jgi:simple sugar transport system ATP-binding protein
VVSEDIDELYSISDRICAICDGELSPLAPTQDVSINQLGMWMAGDFHALNTDAENNSSSTHTPTSNSAKDQGAMKSC